MIPNAAALSVWDALMAAGGEHGIVPAGLGARDTLRTEMGYPLHGQDISPSITPVQARLGWAVGWKKDALLGRRRRCAPSGGRSRRGMLRGLVADGRGIPRPQHAGVDSDGARRRRDHLRHVLADPQAGVGLALLDAGIADGDEVSVDVRGRREAFTVTKPPFVTPGVRES